MFYWVCFLLWFCLVVLTLMATGVMTVQTSATNTLPVCKSASSPPTMKTFANQSVPWKSEQVTGEVEGVDVFKLRQDLLLSEGLRLKPYKDTVGKLTIGVGHNLDDEGITKEEALYLLHNDILDVIKDLRKIPHYSKFVDGNDVRERVIAEMVFNLGIGGVLKFKKMWKAIEMEDWDQAAKEMLNSQWARQVGKRANRLSERMRSGRDLISNAE